MNRGRGATPLQTSTHARAALPIVIPLGRLKKSRGLASGGEGGAVEDDAVAGLIGRGEPAFRVLPGLRDHSHRDFGRPRARDRDPGLQRPCDGVEGLDLGGSSAQSVILMLIALTVLQLRYVERRVQYQ
jgi:hypothetical protein